ncbi:hypothetical protein BMJ22_00525 [Sinorhizobium medicae]|nr:hypothetical protein BMJ22_00525 [Sinorhizobium medicae]
MHAVLPDLSSISILGSKGPWIDPPASRQTSSSTAVSAGYCSDSQSKSTSNAIIFFVKIAQNDTKTKKLGEIQADQDI